MVKKLTFTVPKDATPPIFAEKTFANSYKTAKFMKVFSLKSFVTFQENSIYNKNITEMFCNEAQSLQ